MYTYLSLLFALGVGMTLTNTVIPDPASEMTAEGVYTSMEASLNKRANLAVVIPDVERNSLSPDLNLTPYAQAASPQGVGELAQEIVRQGVRPADDIHLALYDVQGTLVHTFYQGLADVVSNPVAEAPPLVPGLYYVTMVNATRGTEASRAFEVTG